MDGPLRFVNLDMRVCVACFDSTEAAVEVPAGERRDVIEGRDASDKIQPMWVTIWVKLIICGSSSSSKFLGRVQRFESLKI